VVGKRSVLKSEMECTIAHILDALRPSTSFLSLPAFFRFANGEVALPAFISLHRFLAASAIALRPAALIVRFW